MKAKCFVTALLWGILIILFPVASGALSAILALAVWLNWVLYKWEAQTKSQ